MNCNGIDKYECAAAVFYFPEGNICCDLCPAMETYARKQCRLTGEYLLNTKTYGLHCPLDFPENNVKYFKEEANETD